MFKDCKDKYEACDKAITFIYGDDYLNGLDEDEYLRLVRIAKFLFESGMRWQRDYGKEEI